MFGAAHRILTEKQPRTCTCVGYVFALIRVDRCNRSTFLLLVTRLRWPMPHTWLDGTQPLTAASCRQGFQCLVPLFNRALASNLQSDQLHMLLSWLKHLTRCGIAGRGFASSDCNDPTTKRSKPHLQYRKMPLFARRSLGWGISVQTFRGCVLETVDNFIAVRCVRRKMKGLKNRQ